MIVERCSAHTDGVKRRRADEKHEHSRAEMRLDALRERTLLSAVNHTLPQDRPAGRHQRVCVCVCERVCV